MMSKAKVYLIPNLIGSTEIDDVIPHNTKNIIKSLKHFIVEDIRNARRYLKKIDKSIIIDELSFYELNKHSDTNHSLEYLNVCKQGISVGVISEAGMPCIADPGNIIVKQAHKMGFRVIPLSGPSSIIMALISSGFNGQSFAFNGYLPIEEKEKISFLKKAEQKSNFEKQTQIFMDTPYRNNKTLHTILSCLDKDSYLCIACNISCEDEYIKTMKISEWKRIQIDLNKRPCIFVI